MFRRLRVQQVHGFDLSCITRLSVPLDHIRGPSLILSTLLKCWSLWLVLSSLGFRSGWGG